VSTIRLREQTEIPVLVLRKVCQEHLQELPHEIRRGDRRIYLVLAIAEADASGLVHVKNVGDAIPTIRVDPGG